MKSDSKTLYIITFVIFVVVVGVVFTVWTLPKLKTGSSKSTGTSLKWSNSTKYQMIVSGKNGSKTMRTELFASQDSEELHKAYVIYERGEALKKHLDVMIYYFNYKDKKMEQKFLLNDDSWYPSSYDIEDDVILKSQDTTKLLGTLTGYIAKMNNESNKIYTLTDEEKIELMNLITFISSDFYEGWSESSEIITLQTNNENEKELKVCFGDCKEKLFTVSVDTTYKIPEF